LRWKLGLIPFRLFGIISMMVSSVLARGQAPVADFTASSTSGCAPLAVYFTDQSSGSPFSWGWDFGNGQLSTAKNPGVTFSQPGTYTVRLVVKNASGVDEVIKTNFITVFPAPSASFSANLTTACAPATVQFRDQSTVPPGAGSITGWSWDFGDGSSSTAQNPSHTYTATGFYTVSLLITSSTGCKSSASIGKYIRIVNGVNADFSFLQPPTCQAPFTISFQDQSSGPGTMTYAWNFGNGSNSTQQNPATIYPAAGSYPVQLTVQSNLGCNGTITKNILVAGKTTDFTFPSSICIGQTITLQNNSSPAPISSFWIFGDGTNSSQINPTKTFLTGGTFPVKLINNYGNCSDSITKNVTIITQPAVGFTANDSTACNPPFAVKFSDKSPAAATWLWSFGDGGTSNQQNPSHTYTSAGFFDVTLTITLPGGCSNTITKSQYIQIKSTTTTITNAPAGGCVPFVYSPVVQVQSVDSVVGYTWDLGEPGAIYNTKSPTHTYNSIGSYNVKLTVTTQTGCAVIVNVPNGVMVGSKPIAKFSFAPNNACASSPVQFTDQSTTSVGALVQWHWDFGDSVTSTAQNPAHIYKDTGSLVVLLTVTNNGCDDSTSQLIKVIPPVGNFGYTVKCNNRLDVSFVDSSLTDPAAGPISYQWDFGDGTTSTSQTPTHTYASLGTYNATLVVTNGPCSYAITKPVKLIAESADFTVDKNPICKSQAFTLSATTSDSAKVKDYTWTIGPYTIADTTRTVDFTLPSYGNYDVTLTLEDVNGCTNSKTVPNYIKVSGPLAKFSPAGLGACVNGTVNFNDLSTPANGPITQWTWSFGDGTQQTYSAAPFSHTYTETGSYTVTLAIKDNLSCADTVTVPNSVLITSPIAAFKGDTFYCPLAALQFVDTSTGSGLKYTWDFGDGGSSTLQNPTHSFALSNIPYTVKLKITDLVGCQDSVTKASYVSIRTPKPAFDIADSSGFCLPLVTSFIFKGSDFKSFFWDFGDGVTNTSQNPAHFYSSYGTYTPKLYLIGPGGCIDSAQATVNLYDPNMTTKIDFSPTSACNSLSVNFNITIPPVFKFMLYFGDGSVDSSQQTAVSHFYATPGNFSPYVVLSDKFGCDAGIGSATPVNVYGALPVFDKNKKEFCDNGQVFFINYTLHNDPVVSNIWDFGDGSTSSTTDASHFFSGPGMYIVRLTVTTQNQCTNSVTDTIRVYKTPDLSISGKDTVCINGKDVFLGVLSVPDSTIIWQWAFGNGATAQIQNPMVSYSSVGNYNMLLIATNKLACADTAAHSVNVVPFPTASPVSNPLTIISGASALINMNYTGPVVSYNWLPVTNLSCTDCPQPDANPQFTTNYQVQIQDKYGCKNTAEVTVKVICNGQNFFIPNTFSPNGDGVNDVFYLRGSGLFRVKSLMIFNRWGEIVFEKREFPVNDAASGWNGTYKGKKAAPDVYVYQIEIICSNGETIKYSGNIALIQ
jgi:gliding motility-associated-like protein